MSDKAEKPRRGIVFWFSVIFLSVIFLFVGSAILAGIFEAATKNTRPSANFPPDVVGVQNIDAGTDYVFKDELSPIGGACSGWKTISIGRRGHSANDMTSLMCWKEVDGMLHVATEKEEMTIVQPMSNITSPNQ